MNEYNSGSSNGGPGQGGSPYRPNWQTPGQDLQAPGGSGYYPGQSGYGNEYRAPTPPKAPEEPYKYSFEEYDTGGGPRGGKKPPKKGRRGLVVFFSIIGVVVAVSLVVFAGYGVYVMSSGNNFIYAGNEASSAPAEQAPDADAPKMDISSTPQGGQGGAMGDGGLTNEEIASRVTPSVVRIANYQNDSQYGIVDEGSGIIMNRDGYIVTNAHVVEGADGIQVTLHDEESYIATLVGSDDVTDLAVIKLQADPMPALVAAEFGDSDQLKVGERVIAIGNAGGSEFSGSVTGGMISALDREINTSTTRLKVLQTDAAINPGNSGGALVNKHGQVIGIPSAKFIASGYEGLGFAIPINNAKPIVDDLLQNGRVTGRPRLGITGRDFTSVMAQFMGYPNVSGVMVMQVDPTCNIAKQGVIVGDIITKMDGEMITSMNEMKNNIIDHKPGDEVEFEIYRHSGTRGMSGRTFTVKVTLDEDTGETNFPAQGSQQQQQLPQQEDPDEQYPFFPGFPFN